MKTEQCQWFAEKGWQPSLSACVIGASAQVVFLFGNPALAGFKNCVDAVRKAYPKAYLFGCSTAGEIQGASVRDDTVAITAVAFEHSKVAAAKVRIESPGQSFEAGVGLVRQFAPEGLRHLFVLSEGLKVDATGLVNGINSVLPSGVSFSGGCAADGNRLQTTSVWCDGEPQEAAAVALGFYGERLRIGSAAIGGWKPFGPDRLITKSKQNILYEIDGRPALALFKQYLGKHAEGLPANGLMFPLELRLGDGQRKVLRALLAVNEQEQSIMFAGHMPEGVYARFMIGHIEDLLEGTQHAAKAALENLQSVPAQLSLVVSCNGRRFVLKQRIEEEMEAVRDTMGADAVLAGFYSYGEIAPAETGGFTDLHNETMTITSFSEV